MRNLKVLGLAFMAMFALSAVMASAASADEFTAEKYPVTLTGKNTTANDTFVTTTGNVNCKQAAYHGTVSGPTTKVFVTPSYNECTAFGFPAVIDVNECQYVFNVAAGAATTGDADLVCEKGSVKSITVTAIGAGTVKCIVTVLPQSDILGTVTYSNTGSGTTQEVDVEVGLSGIDYSHTKGTGVGACTAGSATNGTLAAKGIVTGEVDPSGVHIGVFMS